MRCFRSLPIACLIFFLLIPFVHAAEKPWLEVRSPHFRVITNASEGSARRVAREYERMRALFAEQFPTFRLDTGAPLLILVTRDESTVNDVFPGLLKHRGPNLAGLYIHGWERQYSMVRAEYLGTDPMLYDGYSVIYHEYLHSLLHNNFRWLPTWLDEGLASFYQYTRFEGSKTMVGAPPRNNAWTSILERGPLIPMDVFLDINPSSPYYGRDQTKTMIFYAQAWAATHYLIFGPDMQQGERLKQFYSLLQQGVEQKKAFQQAFGDFKTIDKGLLQYVQNWAFVSGQLPAMDKLEDKDFTTRTMTLAETRAEMAGLQIMGHNWKEMKAFTDEALKEDAKLGLAHEDMGYYQFNEGKNDEALREFSQAFELDGKLYRSLFARTMISPVATSADPADQTKFHDELMKVLAINPDYAAPYVELAKLYVRTGEFKKALGLARKAEQLELSRSGYHILSGQILLRLGRDEEAANSAAYVANRWFGSDRDEAMELWNSVPEGKRPADALTPLIVKTDEKDIKTAEGLVESTTCKDNSYTLVVSVDGKPRTFHSQGFPAGFTDTFWWGHDHFTPCFHLNGQRAMVRYKSSSDHAYDGDLINVGFRDDLPKWSAKPVEPAKDAGKMN